MDYNKLLNLYRGKKIFITGNTGFKGTWLTKILLNAGAVVTGYSLLPPTDPNLFSIIELDQHPNLTQVIGDIRDLGKLQSAFEQARAEIVLHLAAQPIVRDSYRDPLTTYSTNVMGTVNILECIRTGKNVRSFLNVTTDKVYKNNEWEYGYRENDPLDGFDPYSNSKSCSELVTHGYKNSFFGDDSVRISTVRAGNVIGGGDFANDRIMPDAIRTMKWAFDKRTDVGEILVRNPYSTRPYQHVLEPLFVYLAIAVLQYENSAVAGYYNVGPDDCDCITTGELMDLFCAKWNEGEHIYPYASWKSMEEENAPHEALFLKLECSKVKKVLNWAPKWHIDKAMEKIVEFTKVWMSKKNVAVEMDRQIMEFMSEIPK